MNKMVLKFYHEPNEQTRTKRECSWWFVRFVVKILLAQKEQQPLFISKINLFEEKQVRYIWDEEAEKWRWSILDIVACESCA